MINEPMPNGIYSAAFQGVERFTINGDHVRLSWMFKITSGPYAGQVVRKNSGLQQFSPKCPSNFGKLVTALVTAVDGQQLESLTHFVPELYEGSAVRIEVRDNAIVDVLPARVMRVK